MEDIHIFFERILKEYEENCTIAISYSGETIRLHTKYFNKNKKIYINTIAFNEFELKQLSVKNNFFWEKLAERTIKDIYWQIAKFDELKDKI